MEGSGERGLVGVWWVGGHASDDARHLAGGELGLATHVLVRNSAHVMAQALRVVGRREKGWPGHVGGGRSGGCLVGGVLPRRHREKMLSEGGCAIGSSEPNGIPKFKIYKTRIWARMLESLVARRMLRNKSHTYVGLAQGCNSFDRASAPQQQRPHAAARLRPTSLLVLTLPHACAPHHSTAQAAARRWPRRVHSAVRRDRRV